MKKITLLGLLLAISGLHLSAQNIVWYFGAADTRQTSYGLDFTSGSPVQRNLESALDYYESVTTVSDNSGKVLYYSDGIQVFDGTNQLMVGAPDPLQGTQDGPSGSSVQGAFSLLKPGSQTEYYLFTSQAIDGVPSGFRVNRIDMTLPGNGSVANPAGEMVSADSVLMGTGTEMMTAYGNCGTDSVWIISHSPNSWDFVRVLVTSNGIQSVNTQNLPTPRAFGAGFASSLGRGSMDINADGTQLVFTGQNPIGTHLLDFDRNTGLLSNPIELRAPNGFPYDGYGSEFSPDGTKIYFTSNLVSGMWQYDINTGLSHTIPNSGITHGEIITGVDDNLYVGKVSQSFQMTVGVIADPNAIGAACNYDRDAIAFPSTAQSAISYAMPQGFYCPLNPCQIDLVLDQCDTTDAFQLTATPAGGTWGGGAYITAGGMFDPSAAGVGTHWVTYDAGCDEPDSLEITVATCCPDISPDLGPNISICDDVTHTLDAGSGFNTYRWYENGTLLVAETGSTIEADSGTYVVEVEQGVCSGADTIEIGNHQLPEPDFGLGATSSFCLGLSVTLDAGAGFTDYDWSTGGNSRTEVINSEGTVTVTVTDGNGCEGTESIDIDVDPLPAPTIDGDNIVCENGTADITGSAGSGGTLTWADLGSFSTPRTISSAGTYWLIEEDGNGCIDSVSQTVTQEDAPSINLGDDFAICATQQLDTLDASTGASGESYLWNDASTDPTLEINAIGQYHVLVTSASGCEARDTVNVTGHTLPSLDLGDAASYCAGQSTTLDAGPGFVGYDWSTGDDTRTTVVSAQGTYDVTVTDANGCTAWDDIDVIENALPIPVIGGTPIVCQNSSTSLTGTAGSGGTLSWGDLAPFISPRSISSPGTYWLIEEDANGCIDSVDVTLTLENAPNVDLGGPYEICETVQTEILDASSGTAGLLYFWSGGSTDSTLEVTSTGEYSVVVVNPASGCTAFDTTNVTAHALPTVELGTDTFYCEGLSIDLDAGAGFNSYAWAPSGAGQINTVTSAGTYDVTVTDGNGCSASDTIEIEENELPSVDLGGAISVCESDSLTLDATHPDAVSYLWTPNNENTATIRVGAESETYSVTIVDVDGCEFTALRTIDEDNPPAVDLGGDDVICDDLTKTLDAGFAADVSYEWYLDGALLADTTQTLEADSGVYVVVVRTPAGCEARDTAYIDNYQLPSVSLNDDYEFCELDSVEIDAGIAGMGYSWNTGETTQSIFATTGGTFTVEVTDVNTCTNSASTTVTENSLPPLDLGANDSACVGLEITLDATVPGGTTYTWDDGSTDPIYNLVGPDTLSVIVTDDNNCTAYDTIQVAALDSLDLDAFPANNQVCEGSEEDNPLDAGAFEGATYDWTLPDGGSETGQVITPLLNGTYSVTITDAYNCKGEGEAINVVVPVPNIDLGPDSVFCSEGNATFDVRMEFSDLIPGTITWEDGLGNTDNNNANDTLFTADYTPVTVVGIFTDVATGCVHSDTVELEEFCEPTIIEFPNTVVTGGTDGGGSSNPFRPIGMTDENLDYILNNIKWSDFEVYNRWGIKVFQSKDVLPSWDTHFEGLPVAAGVYYWIYRYKDSSQKEYTFNGFVQLIQAP